MIYTLKVYFTLDKHSACGTLLEANTVGGFTKLESPPCSGIDIVL